MGFLDGDDQYTETCLEEALRNAKETGAGIVSFRRDFEKESEELYQMTELLLWNQLEERIIIDKKNWEPDKMFTGLWITSKIFSYSMLNKYNIRFDEAMTYGEDGLFCIESYAHANRICILPQFIGYHYSINGASLCQMEKSVETIIEYAIGTTKICKAAMKYGIAYNYFAQAFSAFVATFILSSKEITLEDRIKIKKILAPWIKKTTPLPINKIISPELSNFYYNFTRDVILNPESCQDSEDIQRLHNGDEQLTKILDANNITDFGRKYNFTNIHCSDAFRHCVPIMTSDVYKKLICLQTGIGETGIFVSDSITDYVSTETYLVPITRHHIEPYVQALKQTLDGHHNLLVAKAISKGRTFNDNARLNTLESLITKSYLENLLFGASFNAKTICSPVQRFFMESETIDYESFLADALVDGQIDQIVASEGRTILALFDYLFNNRRALVERLSTINCKRAEIVNEIMMGNDAAECIRKIWPKLKRIVANGTGMEAEEKERIGRYIGDIAWNHGVLSVPETILGRATDDNSATFTLDKEHCFYEFIDETDETANPILLRDIQIGRTYRLIITNDSGLYRLYTDYKIRFVENTVSSTIFVPVHIRN